MDISTGDGGDDLQFDIQEETSLVFSPTSEDGNVEGTPEGEQPAKENPTDDKSQASGNEADEIEDLRPYLDFARKLKDGFGSPENVQRAVAEYERESAQAVEARHKAIEDKAVETFVDDLAQAVGDGNVDEEFAKQLAEKYGPAVRFHAREPIFNKEREIQQQREAGSRQEQVINKTIEILTEPKVYPHADPQLIRAGVLAGYDHDQLMSLAKESHERLAPFVAKETQDKKVQTAQAKAPVIDTGRGAAPKSEPPPDVFTEKGFNDYESYRENLLREQRLKDRNRK